MKKAIIFISTAISLNACQNVLQNKDKPKDILAVNCDSSVKASDDFFDYAEGGWLKKNSIPPDQTMWGIGQLVQAELYERLKKINEEAEKKQTKSGIDQQIGDFWHSGMDTVSIEKQGIEPLKSELQQISNAKSLNEILPLVAHLHNIGVEVFYSGGVSQDAKNSDQMAFSLYQGGLGLPNRDYYFNTDERTVKIRNAYPNYIETILKNSGYDSIRSIQAAEAILKLETKLAKASRTLEALRDPYANYNKMAIANLKNISPTIDWTQQLQQLGVSHVDSVIVGQPEFYKQLDLILHAEPMDVVKDYLHFHLVRNYAAYLSSPFVNANFNFYSKLIRGAEAQKPRWKRVLDAEESAMGEVLGQLFAKEYFNATAKKRYEDIVENVRNAYKVRIEKLDWMTDTTKQKALHKLAAIKKKVGYPDKWKDFSSLKIDRQSFAANMMRANLWWNNYEMNKLGKPVDREEWDMTPQTYNAYYNPSNNEIVLPAGIFTVPGYRDEQLDDALVYGYAAASTIGHEITHGFDDEGRQFDENGNLKNWWTKKDEDEFNKRAQVLVNQFNNMIAVDTLHIRGKQTLGENLADLGGILIGLDAFKQTESFKKNETISGFSPLQRFFLGYALGWMYNIRKEELATRILTDVHAPAKFRVNGPMPNVPEFYDAFHVKNGDKMYLPDSLRVRLW
ncbi:MAG: M13 family metallopeptidase [Bacteroidetes bacterium]|nr:M13 family metallopeptidase [Bacteroidota bacterium]MBS1740231.1 M13 family metallopeptidase [Bacteroidota bacterium]